MPRPRRQHLQGAGQIALTLLHQKRNQPTWYDPNQYDADPAHMHQARLNTTGTGCVTRSDMSSSSLRRGETCSHTHGDADVGRRQRRRIIHAVAHVCKRPSVLSLQRANLQSKEIALSHANVSYCIKNAPLQYESPEGQQVASPMCDQQPLSMFRSFWCKSRDRHLTISSFSSGKSPACTSAADSPTSAATEPAAPALSPATVISLRSFVHCCMLRCSAVVRIFRSGTWTKHVYLAVSRSRM